MADKVARPGTKEYDRACLLVGRFIYHFALLESAVNDGVGTLLGMKSLETAIATNNMQLRSKIHILKAAVDLKGGGADWAEAIKTFDAIAALSNERNVVAHTAFGPTENGAVQFLAVKAKSKLTFPNMVWNEKEFTRRFGEMTQLRESVDAVVRRLDRPNLFANAMLNYATTQPRGQAPQNSLARLLQGSPDSPEPTSEESPETPQEPQGE